MTEQSHDDLDAAFNAAMQDSDDSAEQGEQHQSADTDGNDTDLDIQDDGEQEQQQDVTASEDEPDPWSSVPESLRNEFQQTNQALQKLQSDYQAVTGRLAPTQRELDALKKKLAEQEQLKDTSSKGGPSAEELAGMTDEELEQEWPELAAALKRRDQQILSRIDERVTPLQQQLEQQREIEQRQQQEQVKQQELKRLATVHPDYAQVVGDPAFRQWLNNQPKAVKQIASSLSADDNIVLLNLYKQTKSATSKPEVRPDRNDLSDHVQVPRKGAGAPLAVRHGEGDFDSEFDLAMRNA